MEERIRTQVAEDMKRLDEVWGPREPAQPVPLRPCGHAPWMCACEKRPTEPIVRDEDPADVQHEPVVQEGY